MYQAEKLKDPDNMAGYLKIFISNILKYSKNVNEQ